MISQIVIYLFVWIIVHLCDIQPICAEKCLLNLRLEMQFSVTLYNIVQLMLYNSSMKGLWKQNLAEAILHGLIIYCTLLYNDKKLYHHMFPIMNSVILFDLLRMIVLFGFLCFCFITHLIPF